MRPAADRRFDREEDETVRLAIWSTTTPRENSTHAEMFRRQLAEVELAEQIGIDQIWFFEHHLQPTAPVPSPNLLIAAAARTTRHIRFASMVNILPFRHPLLVAEEAAMLDNLTGGRFDMGLGRGLRPPEFEAFGVDQQQSRDMFVESFEMIRRIWSDEIFVEQRRLFGDQQRLPERQDVDHAGEADMAGRPRRGGDQQVGRGYGCGRLQMVLEEPDLIDADLFGELDLGELTPEHFHMGRIFARGSRRPDRQPHRIILPAIEAAMRRDPHGPRRGLSRQSPWRVKHLYSV